MKRNTPSVNTLGMLGVAALALGAGFGIARLSQSSSAPAPADAAPTAAEDTGGVQAVAIPDEVNSLGADELAATATSLGMAATPAESVTQALATILSAASGPARVLICGSLYLAGTVLADNG